MLIRNKYFPYPVIATGNESYATAIFSNDAEYEKKGHYLQFSLKASTNNRELNELIEQGKAAFVHHIECVQTCYRHAVITDEQETMYQIHESKLNGSVEVTTVIVAKEPLVAYKNSDFSSDYKGFSFDIKRGCLLAIGNGVVFNLNKQKDDLENTSSIFSIAPNVVNPNETVTVVDVNNRNPKIVILLPLKSCNIYKNLGSNLQMQSIMHSMIIVPALVEVFNELKATRNELYNYEDSNCRWFKALKKACEKLNIEITAESLENLDSYKTAQLLMDSPTVRALSYLAGGNDDED